MKISIDLILSNECRWHWDNRPLPTKIINVAAFIFSSPIQGSDAPLLLCCCILSSNSYFHFGQVYKFTVICPYIISGNAFILAVINSGSMRSHSSSVYLTALAAADVILSFGRFPMVLSNAGMAEYEGYRNFYKPIVVTCMYVFSIGEWTSVWIKVRFRNFVNGEPGKINRYTPYRSFNNI